MKLIRNINKLLLVAVAVICLSISANGEVKLASIYGDNMVLQQQSTVSLHGTGVANKELVCSPSWTKEKFKTKINANGKWMLSISTPQAGGPYDIKLDDGKVTILSDVLIGEVWFCSGQSNMEMPVKGFRGQPVADSYDHIVTANPKRQLRMFTVKREWSTTQLEEGIEGNWSKASSDVVADFSAVGFFFGNMIQNALDVPVGLINCSWSASKIEAWMSRDLLSEFKEVELPDVNAKEFGWAAGTPTILFNAMVNPWKGFPIKGVLWYQGEANTPNPELYSRLFPAMIKEWRAFFNNAEMPFYYVQLAPFESGSTSWAPLRQVQLEVLNSVPNVGMATIGDLGSPNFIHPPKKIKVGERLAYWALSQTYGKGGFPAGGPIYQSYKMLDGGIVELTFKYGEFGLTPEKEFVKGFEIAGEDGVFVEAKAQILDGSARVKVWNENIAKPVTIRYCYGNYVLGNLCNNAQIPASPFIITIK